MMRPLKNLKNNIIKTSNTNKYEPLTLKCNEALTTFYMNNLDLCSDVLKTTDVLTRRFIISGLVENLDMAGLYEYKVKYVKAYDNFAFSKHIECVTLLEKM